MIIASVAIFAIVAIMVIICTELSTLIYVLRKSQNFRCASCAVTAVLIPASTPSRKSEVVMNKKKKAAITF